VDDTELNIKNLGNSIKGFVDEREVFRERESLIRRMQRILGYGVVGASFAVALTIVLLPTPVGPALIIGSSVLFFGVGAGVSGMHEYKGWRRDVDLYELIEDKTKSIDDILDFFSEKINKAFEKLPYNFYMVETETKEGPLSPYVFEMRISDPFERTLFERNLDKIRSGINVKTNMGNLLRKVKGKTCDQIEALGYYIEENIVFYERKQDIDSIIQTVEPHETAQEIATNDTLREGEGGEYDEDIYYQGFKTISLNP